MTTPTNKKEAKQKAKKKKSRHFFYLAAFGLECYECQSGKSMDACDNTRTIKTCSENVTSSCYKYSIKYKVGDFIYIGYGKGCSSSRNCYNFLTYQLCKAADGDCNHKCCEGDHCNGGTVSLVSVLLMGTCVLMAYQLI